MLTYSFYESDNRVMRYAEALAEHGDEVDVLALRRQPAMPRDETINGVRLHRVQDRFGKDERSKYSYLWPLLRFVLTSFCWISMHARRNRYDLVHVHNVPDFVVFGSWPARLMGAKVILDIHDILPEFFASKFRASEKSALVWGLTLVEKASAAMAHHVVLSNHLWLERYSSRSARKDKCSVFINHVDQRLFRTRPDIHRDDPAPLLMFPGGLQWHQGLDIAIRAFAKLRTRMPDARFHLYGDGSMKPLLIALAQQLQLGDSVRFFDPLPLEAIAAVMATADLGVVAKRADSFGNEAYSTKIMEFMALGVPVVVSATKIDRHYFDETVVRFFESGNDDALAEAMFEVLTNSGLRDRLIHNSLQYVERNCWDRNRSRYLGLVDSLVADAPAAVEHTGAAQPRAD